MAKNNETNKNYEAWRKQRKDWGNVNPVTKIICNKKKDHKLKYPKRQLDNGE